LKNVVFYFSAPSYDSSATLLTLNLHFSLLALWVVQKLCDYLIENTEVFNTSVFCKWCTRCCAFKTQE